MRKHTFLLLLSLWGASPLCAQAPKGAAPLITHHSSLITHHSTRAVVIGISDYQDPAIPDLQFAHRDAEAFVDWLRSPAGGVQGDDRIRLLVNQNATTGKIVAAFEWLIQSSRSGDKAIIYFSGHGDVEKVTRFQRGYWLTWDSPPSVYAAGAFSLAYLQDILSTLYDSGVQVIVVSDACRAGKLAGSDVGGAQATANVLAKQYADEIKILSCQPDEFSIEGTQWGGGRGCFSYHLVDALYGMADANEDQMVSLLELGRYLEDHVPGETAPHRQIPFVTGNRGAFVARVEPSALAEWTAAKKAPPGQLENIDYKGLSDRLLLQADSSLKDLFDAFSAALERGELIPTHSSTGPTANDYYEILIKEPALQAIHGLMTRNLAAALIDDSQQALNRWMRGDVREFEVKESYRPYPKMLGRAAELLGPRHYLYRELQARRLFFEGFLLHAPVDNSVDQETGRKALALFEEALQWQPEFPLAYFAMSYVYRVALEKTDSTHLFLDMAIERAPKWLFPYDAKYEILPPAEGIVLLDKVRAIDSNWIWLWIDYAGHYTKLGDFGTAERMLERARTLDSSYFLTYSRMGYIHFLNGKGSEAEKALLKAVSLSQHCFECKIILGNIYLKQNRFPEADTLWTHIAQKWKAEETAFSALAYAYRSAGRSAEALSILKTAAGSPGASPVRLHYEMGKFYLDMNQPDAARQQFDICLQLKKRSYLAYLGYSLLMIRKNDPEGAVDMLRKALGAGMPPYYLTNTPALRPIMESASFQELVNKHFPTPAKD